jgi:phage shock protein C
MINSRGELHRNTDKARIAGVCAGIADYLGWEIWLVRILIVSGVLFGMPFLIFAYVAGWFILDKAPKFEHNKQDLSGETSKETFNTSNESIKVKSRIWQSGEPPKQALYDISLKFSSLERKVQTIEQYVTSTEFTVAREINKL